MIDVVSFSEPGGHAVNEDAFVVLPHPSIPDCWLCALADGQGGRAGGARAARLACDTAIASMLTLNPGEMGEVTTWFSIFRSADEAVRADREAGFTTLVGFCIVMGIVCGASSGDSGALLLHGDGEIEELTAHQQKNPPVGSGAAKFVPFVSNAEPPWTLLAMSDGVWKYVGWDRVIAAGRTHRGQELIDTLAALARLSGSGRFQDDFTVVAFHGSPPDRTP